MGKFGALLFHFFFTIFILTSSFSCEATDEERKASSSVLPYIYRLCANRWLVKVMLLSNSMNNPLKSTIRNVTLFKKRPLLWIFWWYRFILCTWGHFLMASTRRRLITLVYCKVLSRAGNRFILLSRMLKRFSYFYQSLCSKLYSLTHSICVVVLLRIT